MKTSVNVREFLNRLNDQYSKLHTNYEENFWVYYMGDHSKNKRMNEALLKRDAFRSDRKLSKQVEDLLKTAKGEERERLSSWKLFFGKYQTPESVLPIREKIGKIEDKVLKERSTRKEGYIDPHSKKFIVASEPKMNTMIRTHDDEKVRKACFVATEKLAEQHVSEYVELVKLRNQYARGLGYNDFYEYRLKNDEGMSKKELFDIFDKIYLKTRFAHKNIRDLEKKRPNLRKPWNFGYMMAGDFTKEEDPYFQFEDGLLRWGRSFAALGVDFQKGKLNLDLLDRKGKYNNGFCHWPRLVSYKNNERIAGRSNFTCNTVIGQVGSGVQGIDTLFHEGGHAAHLLNSEQKDVCLNHEYAPMSTAWAETQSMFMDSLFSSIEWKTRYAKNEDNKPYPLDLFKRKIERLHILQPLGLMGIIFVSSFEKMIYEEKNLTQQKVRMFSKQVYKKYFDRSEDSLDVLGVPHIYSWESSAYYHGYGLAQLGVFQWRKYFYDKYGYIVDNPNVGKEMKKVWGLGAKKTFKEFILLATGKKISPVAFLEASTMSMKDIFERARKRIKKMDSIREYSKPVKLNASISMSHGKKTICDNKKSFEDMAKKYKAWIEREMK